MRTIFGLDIKGVEIGLGSIFKIHLAPPPIVDSRVVTDSNEVNALRKVNGVPVTLQAFEDKFVALQPQGNLAAIRPEPAGWSLHSVPKPQDLRQNLSRRKKRVIRPEFGLLADSHITVNQNY